jgi:Putative addiction module component
MFSSLLVVNISAPRGSHDALKLAAKLWRDEAARRLDELKSGRVVGIPAEKVIRKARSSLR